MKNSYENKHKHRLAVFLASCAFMLPAFLFSNVRDGRVLPNSTKLAVGKLCVAQWNDSQYLGKILVLSEEEEMATVRLFDRWKNMGQWPEIPFCIDCLEPFQPHKESRNNLEELVASLKSFHLLQTPAIERAGLAIDRSWFCPTSPYHDCAVSIGHNACISSPHMHFCALELCAEKLDAATSILDVGSGSGYMVAMFSYLAPYAKVVGIEYLHELVEKSQSVIEQKMSPEIQERMTILEGDGEKGVPEQAPFDVIHVGFMCEEIPEALIDQLRPGGRMIIPVGNSPSRYSGCLMGEFTVIDKLEDGSIQHHHVFPCSYVPSANSEHYMENDC